MKEKTKDLIIAGLLANTTVRATSQAIGVAESTIYRYLNDEQFKKEYESKRRDMLVDNCHKLQANMGKAINELVEIIDSKDTAPQIRLNAIDTLLRHTYKQTEIVDILTRLEALENMN